MNRLLGVLLVGLICAKVLAAANLYENPVRALDLPDPSLIRTRDGYWATATSADWAPHFPLFFSKDLVNWEQRSAVFPQTPPWARGSFWAPEITEHRGTYFVYYTARRHDGRLAVAVATAPKPEGPYTDHGELVAQEMGSIDAAAVTDDAGRRWMLWKEDGNSRQAPTRIFLQRLDDEGLRLVGERRAILTNDATWEGQVVEAPFVLKRGDFYYLFYSGAGCCGQDCNYALGVARAKQLEGPWEKCPANPLIADNETWRCPGHGSIVQDSDGRYWLLYHAYAREGFVITGRQMLLDEVAFNADGWPSINQRKGPSRRAEAPALAAGQRNDRAFFDPFDATSALQPGWQWPIGREPKTKLEGGWLSIAGDTSPLVLAQLAGSASFQIETLLKLPPAGSAGLAVIANTTESIGLVVQSNQVRVVRHQRSEETEMASRSLAATDSIKLRITNTAGRRFRFEFAAGADDWREISSVETRDIQPQWDRPVRVGLQVTAPKSSVAKFDYFTLRNGVVAQTAP